jgi:hypothetical protein
MYITINNIGLVIVAFNLSSYVLNPEILISDLNHILALHIVLRPVCP